MESILDTIREELTVLNTFLKKLKRYKGNSVYLKKYNMGRLSFEKKYKLLLQLIPKDSKVAQEHLKEIAPLVVALKEKSKYSEKVKAISKIREYLDELEIELHDVYIPEKIFPKDLEGKLKRNSQKNLEDLGLVYGRSGDCTAFLLRKILEKSLLLTFLKNGLAQIIEIPGTRNKFLPLSKLINLAGSEKIKGQPILRSTTANKIAGIKFLGDTSAHGLSIDVEMEEIIPQMPFIIIALKELNEYF